MLVAMMKGYIHKHTIALEGTKYFYDFRETFALQYEIRRFSKIGLAI